MNNKVTALLSEGRDRVIGLAPIPSADFRGIALSALRGLKNRFFANRSNPINGKTLQPDVRLEILSQNGDWWAGAYFKVDEGSEEVLRSGFGATQAQAIAATLREVAREFESPEVAEYEATKKRRRPF